MTSGAGRGAREGPAGALPKSTEEFQMFSIPGRNGGRLRWLVPIVALSFAACELDVSDPSVIRGEELAGPSSVPTVISGVVGDFASATEHYVLYSSMFTDEMILAGTFPTRVEVDTRQVLQSNATVTGEVAEPLHVARSQANEMFQSFNGFLGDEDFNQQDLLEGIAIGRYVEALMHLQLGEIYCATPIEPGGDELGSDQVVSAALSLFQEAETAAADAGLEDWRQAALVGQARAHQWLGDHGAAAAAALQVDDGHRLFVEYSTNDPEQFNKVFDLSFGSQNEVIRWTVGAGLDGQREGEKFALYDLFADSLGIVDPDPGLTAFNSNIDVHTPEIYNDADDDIAVSSGIHARLIEAEAAIRGQHPEGADAETLINDVRTTWQERWTSERFRVDVGLGDVDGAATEKFGASFGALTQNEQLLVLADELARETWLTGVRQEVSRRFVEEFGAGTEMDLYPVRAGDQICWPVPEQEDLGAIP